MDQLIGGESPVHKKPLVISIINQKGGVAKTTTAINLAHGLTDEGFSVLLLDLDPQGNATSILSDPQKAQEETIYEVFSAQTKLGAIIQPTNIGKLDFVPSSIKLAETESLLAGSIDGFFRLQDSLEKLNYDFIIIDCPPALSMLTVNALVASFGIIIPIQISKFSIDGIQSILDTIGSVRKRYNGKLYILGALVTFYNPRTTISQSVLPTISQYLPVFEVKISQSVVVEEAHLLKKTLFSYKNRSKPALEYHQLVKELLNVIQKR